MVCTSEFPTKVSYIGIHTIGDSEIVISPRDLVSPRRFNRFFPRAGARACVTRRGYYRFEEEPDDDAETCSVYSVCVTRA